MSKREIDALMTAIPGQVKAAHASVRDVNTKNTGPEAMGKEGYDDESSVIICPSDYGFDMFGSTGPEYIKERSREIAKQSLAVHGKPGGGVDHADQNTFAGVKGRKDVDTVESAGVIEDGEEGSEKIMDVELNQKYGRSQGVD